MAVCYTDCFGWQFRVSVDVSAHPSYARFRFFISLLLVFNRRFLMFSFHFIFSSLSNISSHLFAFSHGWEPESQGSWACFLSLAWYTSTYIRTNTHTHAPQSNNTLLTVRFRWLHLFVLRCFIYLWTFPYSFMNEAGPNMKVESLQAIQTHTLRRKHGHSRTSMIHNPHEEQHSNERLSCIKTTKLFVTPGSFIT